MIRNFAREYPTVPKIFFFSWDWRDSVLVNTAQNGVGLEPGFKVLQNLSEKCLDLG